MNTNTKSRQEMPMPYTTEAEQTILVMEQRANRRIQNLSENLSTVIVHNVRILRGKETKSKLTLPERQYAYHFGNIEQTEAIPHQHNVFLMMLVLAGTITHHVGTHVFRYTEGHCCFLNKNVDHVEGYSGDTEVAFIFLRKEFLKQFFLTGALHHDSEEKIFKMVSSFVLEESFICDNTDKVYYDFTPYDDRIAAQYFKLMIEKMEKALLRKEAGSTFLYLQLLCSLFQKLWSSEMFISSKIRVTSGQQEFLFNKMRQLIDANHGRISRAQLSKLLNYNGEYLNMISKSYSGMTIQRMTDESTLLFFHDELLRRSIAVNDLLEELGVTNRTRFFHLFKAKYGMTPGKMRKGAAHPGSAGKGITSERR